MKIVVYWEHSSERAIAMGLIGPLQKWLRHMLHGRAVRYSVAAHDIVDGLTEERIDFDATIEKALGVPSRSFQRQRMGANGWV